MSECARFESREIVVLICLAQLLAVKRSTVVMETSAVEVLPPPLFQYCSLVTVVDSY